MKSVANILQHLRNSRIYSNFNWHVNSFQQIFDAVQAVDQSMERKQSRELDSSEKMAIQHAVKSCTFKEIFRLISFYEDYPCLYNVNSLTYKNKTIRELAMNLIAVQFSTTGKLAKNVTLTLLS